MNKAIKKYLAMLLTTVIFTVSFGCPVHANTTDFSVGDYLQIGEYNGISIVWRYVGDDANGKLMVSDMSICEKRYSSPRQEDDYQGFGVWEKTRHWKASTIRAWLNSTASAGNVVWEENNPPFDHRITASRVSEGYADEAGFLHSNNFSLLEQNLMKPVTQWTMVPGNNTSLSENGVRRQYDVYKEWIHGPGKDDPKVTYWSVSELLSVYYGAAYQSTDKVFLLDELQVYLMWENLGSATAEPIFETDSRFAHRYILRGGFSSIYDGRYSESGSFDPIGIRPAFYIDEGAIETITGSGTSADPYVLNENPSDSVDSTGPTDTIQQTSPSIQPNGITVLSNGEEIVFDQPPIMELGTIIFVPMRAVFENLGTEVSWDGATQTITAISNEATITVQIDNAVMTKNGKEIILPLPPRLVDGRTLVPISAIAEGFDVTIDWNKVQQKVTIISN